MWQKNEWNTWKWILLKSIWHRNKRSTDSVHTEAGISNWTITPEARLIHCELGQKLLWDLQFHSLISLFWVFKAEYFS